MFDLDDPNPPPSAPYAPSDIEARHYYRGLRSKPRLVARSSCDVWMRPTGLEVYLVPKVIMPLGTHRLNEIWEEAVGPAMDRYLQEKQVRCNSMTPLRIGAVGQASLPAVVLIAVQPGSLPHELGVEVAIRCHSILVDNGVDDVHVEIRESKTTLSASMYKPAISGNPAFRLREPFSTSLGIPICNSKAKTSNLGGTGGFFFTDSAKPGILFMVTTRHVLFDPDTEPNTLYEFKDGSGAPRRDVMMLGKVAFKARVEAIKAAIIDRNGAISHLNDRLKLAGEMEDEDDAAAERRDIQLKIDDARKAIAAFEKLLPDVDRDWKDEGDRVIGHVVLSPPLSCNFGEDGYTDDWAVVQIHPTKISKLNFVGNAIGLGSVEVGELTAWMRPDPAAPRTFYYPGDRLLRSHGTISDQEMFGPPPGTKDHGNAHDIMVLKNGNASGLTVGRLNTIRSFVRYDLEGQPGQMSRELAVLPRSSTSGPFSEPGDSGSVVIDGAGRICGIITGGDGATDDLDYAFVTSINFIVKRLQAFGIEANVFPSPADL